MNMGSPHKTFPSSHFYSLFCGPLTLLTIDVLVLDGFQILVLLRKISARWQAHCPGWAGGRYGRLPPWTWQGYQHQASPLGLFITIVVGKLSFLLVEIMISESSLGQCQRVQIYCHNCTVKLKREYWIISWRTKLSRCRMIRLLPHPLPPSCRQVVSFFQSSCEPPAKLAD
jgi:hypothetical protein